MNDRFHFWRFSVLLLLGAAILCVLHRYPDRDVHTQRVLDKQFKLDSAWKKDHMDRLNELRAQSVERTDVLKKALDAWMKCCACDTVPCPPVGDGGPVRKRRRNCGCKVSIGSIWNWGQINGLVGPTVLAGITDTLHTCRRHAGTPNAHERAGLEQALMAAEQNYLREVGALLQGLQEPIPPVAPNAPLP